MRVLYFFFSIGVPRKREMNGYFYCSPYVPTEMFWRLYLKCNVRFQTPLSFQFLNRTLFRSLTYGHESSVITERDGILGKSSLYNSSRQNAPLWNLETLNVEPHLPIKRSQLRWPACCGRRARGTSAQSFTLWQQATIKITRTDHIYPLYTALLWDSRWIGNPINHSSTTVSVSPSRLSAHFFQLYAIQRIQVAEVGWESDNNGFDRKWGWVVCIVLDNLFCTCLMLKPLPWTD